MRTYHHCDKEKGIDGNKKIKGIKLQIIVDCLGLILAVYGHAANIHDSKAAYETVRRLDDNKKQILYDLTARYDFFNHKARESSKPYDMGSTPTSFSPDFIDNNTLTFSKKGFNASIVTHFVGKQYLTNTGIDNYTYDGKEYAMYLDKYSSTDIDLSYTFNFKTRPASSAATVRPPNTSDAATFRGASSATAIPSATRYATNTPTAWL